MSELFIASRTRGLAVWRSEALVVLDPVTGLNALAAHAPSNTLYGITGEKVLAWRVVPGSSDGVNKVHRIDQAPSGGDNSCHLLVLDRHLLIAHYDSGSISCIPLRDSGEFAGAAGLLTWTGSGPDRTRQSRPHPHQLHRAPIAGVGTQGGAVVVDLGSDALVCLSKEQLESADLRPGALSFVLPETVPTPAGSGPRHAVAIANGGIAVSAELSSELLWCNGGDSWQKFPSTREVDTEGERNYPSDIVAHPGGSVMLANRGRETVSFWSRAGEFLELAAGGRWPQSLLIDNDRLLVACEREDSVTAFMLDSVTGMPHGKAHKLFDCPAPAWLLRL